MLTPLKSMCLFAGVSLCWHANVITAYGQSVAPLKQTVRSFGETYIAQIQVGNNYATAQRTDINIYDKNWKRIEPRYISKKTAIIGGEDSITVTLMMSFTSKSNQGTIHVCNAILPRVKGIGAAFRGEACATIIANRLSV